MITIMAHGCDSASGGEEQRDGEVSLPAPVITSVRIGHNDATSVVLVLTGSFPGSGQSYRSTMEGSGCDPSIVTLESDSVLEVSLNSNSVLRSCTIFATRQVDQVASNTMAVVIPAHPVSPEPLYLGYGGDPQLGACRSTRLRAQRAIVSAMMNRSFEALILGGDIIEFDSGSKIRSCLENPNGVGSPCLTGENPIDATCLELDPCFQSDFVTNPVTGCTEPIIDFNTAALDTDLFVSEYTPLIEQLSWDNLFLVMGNHDLAHKEWFADSPDNNLQGRFTLNGVAQRGPAALVFADVSNCASNYVYDDEQLRRDLSSEAAKLADFVIVFFHLSPVYYNNGDFVWGTPGWVPGEDRQNPQSIYEQIVPVLDEHQVDLVVMGHIHNYFRTSRGGIPYIVSGAAGAYWRNGGTLDANEYPHYIEFTVRPSSPQLQGVVNKLWLPPQDPGGADFTEMVHETFTLDSLDCQAGYCQTVYRNGFNDAEDFMVGQAGSWTQWVVEAVGECDGCGVTSSAELSDLDAENGITGLRVAIPQGALVGDNDQEPYPGLYVLSPQILQMLPEAEYRAKIATRGNTRGVLQILAFDEDALELGVVEHWLEGTNELAFEQLSFSTPENTAFIRLRFRVLKLPDQDAHFEVDYIRLIGP